IDRRRVVAVCELFRGGWICLGGDGCARDYPSAIRIDDKRGEVDPAVQKRHGILDASLRDHHGFVPTLRTGHRQTLRLDHVKVTPHHDSQDHTSHQGHSEDAAKVELLSAELDFHYGFV